MSAEEQFDLGEACKRAAELSATGSTVEKAAAYLNAEFHACFYAVKRTLWVAFTDRGQERFRAIGAFA